MQTIYTVIKYVCQFYYRLKEYDKALADEHKAEELGYPVDPKFIDALKKASGKN